MTDTALLDQAINDSGVTITFLADRLSCSRNRIYAIKAGAECTAKEIVMLSEALHLTKRQRDDIFLSSSVNQIHAETAG